MTSLIKKLTLLIIVITSAQQSLAQELWIQRCDDAKIATGVSYTFNAEETKAIRKWTARCAPRFIHKLAENRHVGFMQDGKPVKRIVYPVFGLEELVPDPSVDIGVRVEYSNPRKYEIKKADVVANPDTAACDIPEDYTIIGFCGAGCFTPGQRLWFPEGDMAIGEAELRGLKQVMTLGEDSTLDNVSYQVSEITGAGYIQTKEPQKEAVVTLMTAHKSLTVTLNHPMIMADGSVRKAEDVKVGDQLINVDGEKETVVNLERDEFFGKVLNVETAQKNLQSHILVAEGLLTGDFAIQTMELQDANRHLLRSSLFPVQLFQ